MWEINFRIMTLMINYASYTFLYFIIKIIHSNYLKTIENFASCHLK